MMRASMTKRFASEAAVKHSLEAVQPHGGYGYIKGYPVERPYRDAKATPTREGNGEVRRILIARSPLEKGLMPWQPFLTDETPVMKFADRMSLLGTETAFEVLAKARALEAQGRDIVHLEIGGT